VYWIFTPRQFVQVVDVRSRTETVPGQEVLSADNVSVKVSAVLRYRVSAPDVVMRATQSFQDAFYLETQVIVRDIIAALPIEDLLQKREEIAKQLRERLEPRAKELGLTLEMVGVKDIMFPGPLKRIFAQVVEARKSALASLEKARGETATLRHLANAARLLESNPALLMLKTLQAVSEGKNTIVLGISQPVIPISKEPEMLPAQPPPPATDLTPDDEGA
jgi:regulator of protease activity HflC (stomatin/prohibitin superfamily)